MSLPIVLDPASGSRMFYFDKEDPRVLFGDFLTGEIYDEIDAASCSWAQELNDTGSVSQVIVPEAEVRRLDLRHRAQSIRTFLAVEQNDRIREAGPLVSRSWDWQRGQLTLGAAGFWWWLDRRVFQSPDSEFLTIANRSLGGIARSMLFNTTALQYSNPPLVLPPQMNGTHTETFWRWNLPRVGEQLRQLTQRAVDAPDIRFRPRRRADDRRYLEWVADIGTEDEPKLSQVGNDWVFDATAPRNPVRGIGTDEDASNMAEQVWVTGNGMEQDMLLARSSNLELLEAGWPLTEATTSRPTVEDRTTLIEHSDAFLEASNRPIEAIKVTVRADAATEVLAGHYCRVKVADDPWLPDGEFRMRIAKISGTLGDDVTLDMYPMQAVL